MREWYFIRNVSTGSDIVYEFQVLDDAGRATETIRIRRGEDPPVGVPVAVAQAAASLTPGDGEYVDRNGTRIAPF